MENKPTEDQIKKACFNLREDFFLLSIEEQDALKMTAVKWFNAWNEAMQESEIEDRKIKEWYDKLH